MQPMAKQKNPNIEEGSGNVFADLGFADAGELFARAQIGFHVFKILEDKNLTQRKIARILAIPQPEVSHLMNGHYSRFTTDKMVDFLKRLGHAVSIRISPTAKENPFRRCVSLRAAATAANPSQPLPTRSAESASLHDRRKSA
jgi:predicted XRE-type DNA-binding protein